jgi:hypothetical protein
MKVSVKLLLLTLLVTLTTTACKEAHDDDHLDIAAFRIISNGEIVAQQNGTQVTGSISVAAQTTSALMTLEFRDPEGNILNITDDDLYLQVDSSAPTVARVQNAATNRWGFTLTGVSQGSASITIKLMHGNHADFESRPISVTVN